MIKTWAIIIPKGDSTEPALYYNDVRDKWVQDFQGGCCFFDEKSALNKLIELNILGVTVVEGTVN